MNKIFMYTFVCSLIFVGCDGCVDDSKTTVAEVSDTGKEVHKIEQNENIDKMPDSKVSTKLVKQQHDINKTLPQASTSVADTQKETAPELEELGSPLNPYPDSGEDEYDPNSPQNAKPIHENRKDLPAGHPLNARKIDKNDPDLLEQGSPANPIEDFTGEDISK